MRNPNWVSQNWRFRNDDGTLVTATYIKAEDTAVVAGDQVGASTTFRLRFNFADTNNADSNNTGSVTIQYRVNTGGGFGSWTTVPTTAGADGIAMGSSSQAITDGDGDTTQRLTDITGATFDGTLSEYDENNSLTSQTWIDDSAEFEFCLTLSSGTEDNIYEFRLLAPDAGVPDSTPAADASLTVYNANHVIDGSQTPDLDPDPLVFTGNAPLALQPRFITPATTSIAFDGTGITGGPINSGGNMGSGWGVGLAFVGYAPTITVSAVGGGNIVIDDTTTGTHQFTGAIPTVEIDHYRDVGLDTLQFTGSVPTVEIDHFRDVGGDTLQFTGAAPSVEIDHFRDVGTDTLLFTGNIPTLDYTWVTFPDKDDLQFTGYAPTIKIGITREPGTGTLEFTEATPSAEIDHFRNVGTDALQFSGSTPLVFTGILKQPTTGTLEFTEAAPSAEIDHFRDVGLDTLQFNSEAPTALTGISRTPTTGTLEFTGNIPTLDYTWVVFPGTDALQFTGYAPTLDYTWVTFPSTDSLLFDGKVPIVLSGGNKIIPVSTGSLEFTGNIPTLDYTWVVFPTTASLEFSGITPSVEFDYFRDVGTDALEFTGYAPTLAYSWTVFPGTDALEFTGQQPTMSLAGDTQITVGTASLSFDGTGVTGGPIVTGEHPKHAGWGVGLAFTGQFPSITVDDPVGWETSGVQPDALLISGNAPSAEINHIRDVGTASLQFTTTTPDPETATSPEIDVPSGSLSFTGNVPTLDYTWAIFPSTGSLTLTGYAPDPGAKTIQVGAGSMAFTGQTPSRIDVAHSGVSITNPNATTAIPSNYEQCDYTGFRQLPGSLKLTWNKHAVRRKSWESRHPQETLRNVPERKKGSRRPEQPDRFIEDIGTVDAEDL